MWIKQFPTLLAPCLIITLLDGTKRVIGCVQTDATTLQHCCANNVGRNNGGSCCVRVGSGVQRDATTPNNIGTSGASWEGYNSSLCKPCVTIVRKRRQQLSTLLRKQCWELLRACWQWCANGATSPNNVGTYSTSWEGYNP